MNGVGSPLEAINARIAALRARKDEKSKAREVALKTRELAILELEALLEDETGGVRGAAFEIVDAEDQGLVGMKPGPSVLWKRFQSTWTDKHGKARDPSTEDIQAFVIPCLAQTTREKFLQIVEDRGGVALRCANALSALYMAKGEDQAGKF